MTIRNDCRGFLCFTRLEGSVSAVSGAKLSKQHSGSRSDMAEMMIAEQERKLLEALRKLKYGQIRVIIRNYTIIMMEEKKVNKDVKGQ
ncbi:MAG: DUF2292 domain-containing protein [Oscillospiraceae bacterium]|nr:DUF2292 domain-containing protein [Oscillospiraceae bacterium]